MASDSKDIAGPAQAKLKLYSYWQSNCCQRVIIVLNLKGLDYEYKAVDLLKGDQFDQEFEKLNPIGYVPVLVDGDAVVGDSYAIVLVASIVCSSIQPFHNLLIQKFMETKFNADEKLKVVQHQVEKGLSALEKLLKDVPGKYATGDEVLLADVFLAPQLNFAVTWLGIDMTQYPRLARADAAYNELPAFQAALPERQPDYPSSS